MVNGAVKARIAGIARFFLGHKQKGPPDHPAARLKAVFGRQSQPSAATLLTSRENFREAVFLCKTPRATPRAISGCTRFKASAASVFLPDAIADSTCFAKVRIRLIRAW